VVNQNYSGGWSWQLGRCEKEGGRRQEADGRSGSFFIFHLSFDSSHWSLNEAHFVVLREISWIVSWQRK